MDIGRRLQELREHKNLSQGDIEHKTGLLRCYVSRVENGHTVPSLETLEKFARALGMPLYQILYERESVSQLPSSHTEEIEDWASRGKGRRTFLKLRKAVQKMSGRDRELLLQLAARIASTKRRS